MTMAFADRWVPSSNSPIDNVDWNGYTYSEWLTGSALSSVDDLMRLQLKAGSAGHNIIKMYVGSSLAASPFNFDDTPQQVTFNGDAGTYGAAGADIFTDAFTSPDLTGTRKLLIRVYSVNDGSKLTSYQETDGAEGVTARCWNLADTAADTTISSTSGGSAHNIIWSVETAEIIKTKACVTDSNWRVVFDNPGLVNPTRIKYSEIKLIGTHLVERTGATVSANGMVDSSDAADINDNDLDQSIHMGYGPEIDGVTYARFDFGSGTTVAGVQITSSNDTDGTETDDAPVDFRLQYLKGSSWVTYIQVVGATWTDGRQAQTFYRDGSINGGGETGTVGPPTLDPPAIPANDDFFAEEQTATWGLRRLVGIYGGPLLQIRDTVNDDIIDVQQTFDGLCDVSGLTRTYAVVTVYDQTGQGSDLTQTTEASQPAFLPKGSALETPVIQFDGVDDYLVDVNGMRTDAPYMTPRPSMIWIGGPGIDGLSSYTGFPPNFVMNANPAAPNTSGNAIAAIWWPGTGDTLQIINMDNVVQNVDNHAYTVKRGFGGLTVLGGNAVVFDTNTAHGSETTFTPTGDAAYSTATTIAFGANANGSAPWKHFWFEAYMYDGTLSESVNDINDFVKARYTDIAVPRTLWEITVHSTFNAAGPGSVQSSWTEIQLAKTAGGTDLALFSKASIDPATTATNSINTFFDGLVTTSVALITAGTGVDAVLTFQPLYGETNDAEELRFISPVVSSGISSNRVPKTFGLRRSDDLGVTWIDYGDFDASSQGSPTDAKVYTFDITGVVADTTFDYVIGHPNVTADFTFDYKLSEFHHDFTFDYLLGTIKEHSSWRLLSSATNGDGRMGFADMRMFTIPGGTVVSTGGTPSTSSNFIGDGTAAFDGDPSTAWLSAGVAEWARYDFAAPIAINSITLTSFTIGGFGIPCFPSAFKIQWLDDDGVTWHDAWSVTGASVAAEGQTNTYTDPAYVPPPAVADFAFDYKIALGASFTFSYAIGVAPENLTEDFTFDYKLNTAISVEFTFDYALSVIIGVRADFAFDYQLLPTFSVVNLPTIRMPPESPISELWGYSSNVITAYDGTEQRASLAQFVYQNIAFTYIVLNEDDRRQFNRDFVAISRGICLAPLWQYGVNMKAASLGAESIEYDPTRTDIRSGDFIYYVTPQGLTGFTGQVANVNPTGADLTTPLLAAMPAGSWVMPARRMHWSDGNGVRMKAIEGDVSVSLSGLGLRPPMRQGQGFGLVSFFDGLAVLQQRPNADGSVDELFSGNDQALALAADVETEVFKTWRMSSVAGGRTFKAKRRDGLDYWREFMQLVVGQRVPFLLPTYRQDFDPVSFSTNVLRVAGQDYLPLAGFPAYSRLQIESDAGVNNYVVTGASAVGDDTLIEFSADIVGSELRRVSYLMQTRLAEDVIKLNHAMTDITIDISIRTTNE